MSPSKPVEAAKKVAGAAADAVHDAVSMTGKPVPGAPGSEPPTASAQQGAYLTTATGVRIGDSDHSLKAGPRGPTLLSDHHLREKIMHFDHERMPRRPPRTPCRCAMPRRATVQPRPATRASACC